MILGITGGTGCGKTTLLSCIREQGGLVLDCDEVYHDLLKTAVERGIFFDIPSVFVDRSRADYFEFAASKRGFEHFRNVHSRAFF